MKKITLLLMSLCAFAFVSCATAEGNALGEELKTVVKDATKQVSAATNQEEYMKAVQGFQASFTEVNAKIEANSDERLNAEMEAEIEKLAQEYVKECQAKAAELGIK